jgi:hypothetical protein
MVVPSQLRIAAQNIDYEPIKAVVCGDSAHGDSHRRNVLKNGSNETEL